MGRRTMDPNVPSDLASECGSGSDELARKKARNRLDQRFSRAIARIHEAIEARAGTGELDEEKARGLKAILESLRLRG